MMWRSPEQIHQWFAADKAGQPGWFGELWWHRCSNFNLKKKKTNIDSLKKLFKIVDCHDLENYDGTAVPI